MSDLPVKIRSIKETDHALILDSWVNSVCYSTPAYFWVPQKLCKSIYRRMVGQLLEVRPELFRVLVNEDDEDQIFGWVCGDARVTHFVFVKREFRCEGLAGKLIPDPLKFTHWTKDMERIEWSWGTGSISYIPSLFQELINGISKTGNKELINENSRFVGDSSPERNEYAGQDSQDTEDKERRQAEGKAVGVATV